MSSRGRVTVADGDELEEVFRDGVEPGTEAVLADGTYEDVAVEIDAEATADDPITIRAESEHGAVFTGSSQLRLAGSYVHVRGLRFENSDAVPQYGAVALWGAKHCRVTNCEFEDLYGMVGTVTLQHGARENRIDHNHFVDCRYRAVRVGVHEEVTEHGPPFRNRVDHNVIRDVPHAGDEPEAGSAEAIQIGQWGRPWSAYDTRTVVENNLFLRCNGENEIVSVKTAGNVVRENAFVDCVTGEISLRSAERTTVEGNWFENTNHGVRVLGSRNRVVDNTIVEPSGMGIRVPHGTDDLDYPTAYMCVHSAVVANNTIVNPGVEGVRVGGYPHVGTRIQESERFTEPPFDHPTGRAERDVPPYDSVFVNNVVVGRSGTLFAVEEAPDNVYSTNLLHAEADAEIGHEGNDPILEPPQFAWSENRDFRLSPNSPGRGRGYGEGYPVLPIDEDGLYHVGATGRMPEVGPSPEVVETVLDSPPRYDLEGLPTRP